MSDKIKPNFDSIHIIRKLKYHNSGEKLAVEHAANMIYESVNRLAEQLEYPVQFITKNKVNEKTLIICIGGDGTVLHGAQLAAKTNACLVGVHAGKLGFLCEYQVDYFEYSLGMMILKENLFEKHVLTRYPLTCKINNTEFHSVNEIHFTNRDRSSILYSISCNNHIVITGQLADGLLISTPLGSTAYNLSAGGCIVDHDSQVVQVTPIAPHSLTSRPVILPSNSVIQVSFDGKDADKLCVYSDGQLKLTNIQKLNPMIKINGKGPEVKFVCLNLDRNVFEILAQKMSWQKTTTMSKYL